MSKTENEKSYQSMRSFKNKIFTGDDSTAEKPCDIDS